MARIELRFSPFITAAGPTNDTISSSIWRQQWGRPGGGERASAVAGHWSVLFFFTFVAEGKYSMQTAPYSPPPGHVFLDRMNSGSRHSSRPPSGSRGDGASSSRRASRPSSSRSVASAKPVAEDTEATALLGSVAANGVRQTTRLPPLFSQQLSLCTPPSSPSLIPCTPQQPLSQAVTRPAPPSEKALAKAGDGVAVDEYYAAFSTRVRIPRTPKDGKSVN
jgi:hypothetical protein